MKAPSDNINFNKESFKNAINLKSADSVSTGTKVLFWLGVVAIVGTIVVYGLTLLDKKIHLEKLKVKLGQECEEIISNNAANGGFSKDFKEYLKSKNIDLKTASLKEISGLVNLLKKSFKILFSDDLTDAMVLRTEGLTKMIKDFKKLPQLFKELNIKLSKKTKILDTLKMKENLKAKKKDVYEKVNKYLNKNEIHKIEDIGNFLKKEKENLFEKYYTNRKPFGDEKEKTIERLLYWLRFRDNPKTEMDRLNIEDHKKYCNTKFDHNFRILWCNSETEKNEENLKAVRDICENIIEGERILEKFKGSENELAVFNEKVSRKDVEDVNREIEKIGEKIDDILSSYVGKEILKEIDVFCSEIAGKLIDQAFAEEIKENLKLSPCFKQLNEIDKVINKVKDLYKNKPVNCKLTDEDIKNFTKCLEGIEKAKPSFNEEKAEDYWKLKIKKELGEYAGVFESEDLNLLLKIEKEEKQGEKREEIEKINEEIEKINEGFWNFGTFPGKYSLFS